MGNVDFCFQIENDIEQPRTILVKIFTFHDAHVAWNEIVFAEENFVERLLHIGRLRLEKDFSQSRKIVADMVCAVIDGDVRVVMDRCRDDD